MGHQSTHTFSGGLKELKKAVSIASLIAILEIASNALFSTSLNHSGLQGQLNAFPYFVSYTALVAFYILLNVHFGQPVIHNVYEFVYLETSTAQYQTEVDTMFFAASSFILGSAGRELVMKWCNTRPMMCGLIAGLVHCAVVVAFLLLGCMLAARAQRWWTTLPPLSEVFAGSEVSLSGMNDFWTAREAEQVDQLTG